jgi:enediyne biosynthesis protein E4
MRFSNAAQPYNKSTHRPRVLFAVWMFEWRRQGNILLPDNTVFLINPQNYSHMKLAACVTFAVCVSMQLHAQTFTRITSGSIVTDGGASRSVNWIDYDKDGYLDLFVSNGKRGGERNFLYHNEGNGTFSKITSDPIVTFAQPYDGASWADADGDGDLDCFVVAWYDSNNVFFQNGGNGTFTRPNLGAPVNDRGLSETCSWGDYDNDGRLDLYVSNSGLISTGPKRNFLYHNVGGSLVKVDTGIVSTDQFFSRGVSWIDYDNDGDLDLYVVNEENQANNLYKNMFKESGAAWFSRITTGSIVTDIGSSWSASWGDYDNDGDSDVFVANFDGQNDCLYNNNGNGTFTKVAAGDAVTDGGFSGSSAWADFDNDGDLDLFVTTTYSGAATKNLVYKNLLMETGTATLQKVTSGDIANDTGYSYGCAWGDCDRDGDVDLFLAKTFNENENNALYRNDNANGNHWFVMNCVGSGFNTSAIGAKVRVKAAINGTSVWQLRIVEGQSGYCGQNLQLHFGLGNATQIDSLRIEWPSGAIQTHTNVVIDRVANVIQGGGISSVGQLRNERPHQFELKQNYPNPFNPETTLSFVLERTSLATLKVFDQVGREVAMLLNEVRPSGNHSIEWNAQDVSSGVYYYRLTAGEFAQTKPMLLLK